MIRFFNNFVKATGWPAQLICFRTKVYYENKAVQSRHIRGPAILVSNHTSVYDYAVMLFVFFTRTLRYQMAEILFRGKRLGKFLRMLGGIFVDRDSTNFSFMSESVKVLDKGGVVGIFPEGRLPREGETPPIAFLPGAAYLATSTGVKVIPVYTNGSYFKRSRARVMIGTPMDPADYCVSGRSEKENIEAFTEAMRNRIIELRTKLDERRD